MNKKHWGYLLILTLLGLAVLVAQKGQNRNLEKRIAAVSSELEGLDKPHQKNTKPEGIKNLERKGVSSKQFIEQTTTQLQASFAAMGDLRSPLTFLQALPEMLHSIEDLNATELISVVDILSEQIGGDRQQAAQIFSAILLDLAADQNPKTMWNHLRDLKGKEQASLFSSLMKKDPDAAILWLKEQDLAEYTEREMQKVLISELISRDAVSAIKHIRGLKKGVFSKINQILFRIPDEQISQWESAYKAPGNADVRDEIARVLMASSYDQKGVGAARAQAEKLDLRPDELVAFFRDSEIPSASEEMRKLYDWMATSLPDDHSKLPHLMREAGGQWANRDFKGATEWLGSLKPSKGRDSAIEGFAHNVFRIDPEAAALWVLEIQAPKKREAVLKKVMKDWKTKDSTAAEAWLQAKEQKLE